MRQTLLDTNSRKRRRSNEHSLELEVEDCQTAAKKLKKNANATDPQPATSQGNSSATPLTRGALRALNRENKQAARGSQLNQRLRRPVTRLALAEWRRRHPPIWPSQLYLESCGHEQYKALKKFARKGELGLRDLCGCQKAAVQISDPAKSSQASSTGQSSQSCQSSEMKPTVGTGTHKSLSPYNRLFQQLLIDSHIYPPYYEHPNGTAAPKPENLDCINERLARRRPSLSRSRFSKREHDAFIRKDANTINESDVRTNVIPDIQGIVKDPQTVNCDILFMNLTPFTIDEQVTSGKPDLYHGARPEQLNRSIRKDLDHLVIPSTRDDVAILPSHFTAVKGPDGLASIARRQATYDAYLGARGIHALQNYGQAEPIFDNKAYTFAFIYHSPMLSVFVCHPAQPADPGESPSYYMTPVGSLSMLHNAETWKEGATWYRNAIDLAKEWRDEFIRLANNVIRTPTAAVTPHASISVASTGDQLGALSLESQADGAASGSAAGAFEAAGSSQEEEEQDEKEEEKEEKEVVPRQSSRSRGQVRPGTKRQDREDSGDEGRSGSSSRNGGLQSPTVKRRKMRGKRARRLSDESKVPQLPRSGRR